MSKITINVDTNSNTVECIIDGERFEGIKGVNISSFSDSVFVDIHADMGKVGVDEHLRQTMRIATASDEEATQALKMGVGKLSPDKTLISYAENEANSLLDGAFNLLGKSRDKEVKKKKRPSVY